MEIITKDNVGTKVLKILYRYKLHDSGPDGRGGPSKQFLEYLNAKLIRANPPNLYVALTQAVCNWCSDTGANLMEKYAMIDALAITLSGTNPLFESRMMADRAVAHARSGLGDEDMTFALYLVDAIHEQQEEMK